MHMKLITNKTERHKDIANIMNIPHFGYFATYQTSGVVEINYDYYEYLKLEFEINA